ncbi:MAG: glycosyl hydrolase [Thermoguttaceae bacterium]|nr:glycosyl hydrolase [Thermoguttaceae bacterium]MDW8039183.1 glycosyl hydrolase [Thermoguttaceae bacterium]
MGCLWVVWLMGTWLGEGVVGVGEGSYTEQLPAGRRGPPSTVYVVESWKRPVPTNDWYSSLVARAFSEAHYGHPLAFQAMPEGMRVYAPGRIHANDRGFYAAMPAGRADLVIGASPEIRFTEARAEPVGDWFVRAHFVGRSGLLKITYGHGCPLVFVELQGGKPEIRLPASPSIWFGQEGQSIIGLRVEGKPYVLFGLPGSRWRSGGTGRLVLEAKGAGNFSIGLLPEESSKLVEFFHQYAYQPVMDSRIHWQYDSARSRVRTTFEVKTANWHGTGVGTVLALYPHQWRWCLEKLFPYEYPSVRGPMRLWAGTRFQTEMTFPGVLPYLPISPGCDRSELKRLLAEESKSPSRQTNRDTYWEGKYLGKLASLIPLAHQVGETALAERWLDEIQERLEDWFRVGSQPDRDALFYYDRRWGSLIGYPDSYGSATELNDHHFHYGYFIRAAAELAAHRPDWASAKRYGSMVQLLIRDIASPDREDPLFPFLRCFDPYAGHSWASGLAPFADGNNQESSSEAMNAWYAIILWGLRTGDEKLRDLGVFLYTMELHAIEEYWFNVWNTNWPRQYPCRIVSMVWGGKSVYETWFSPEPEAKFGINWLPIHAGSLYLGRHPAYCQQAYEALRQQRKQGPWQMWADLVWMYRAMSDPADAWRMWQNRPERFRPEAGNSLPATYQWICFFRDLGLPDRSVTANWPYYAVLTHQGRRTYLVYVPEPSKPKIVFSDGFQCQVQGPQLAILSAQ